MDVEAIAIEKSLDVIAIGEAMIEFNQRDGHTNAYAFGFGGDTSNAAIAAARMGARVGYLTHVGDDVFGDALRSLWHDEGVDVQGVNVIAGATTGIYFVNHTALGHQFSYRRAKSAASQMSPASIDLGKIKSAKWLHASSISQAISASACDTVMEAISIAKASGTQVSYDLNYRPALWPAARARAMVMATLAHCDLFLPSVDEMMTLTGLTGEGEIIAWAHAMGAKNVALKLGARGALISDGATTTQIPPFAVTPLDATGAGDCFAGSLLAQMAAGDTLAQAARAACVAAALSTHGIGAVSPLPTKVQVMRALER